jgi:hypothetical protein
MDFTTGFLHFSTKILFLIVPREFFLPSSFLLGKTLLCYLYYYFLLMILSKLLKQFVRMSDIRVLKNKNKRIDGP